MTPAAVVWLTGLPSSGKSTLARRVTEQLRERGQACCVLDGDELRDALCPRPGYDPAARDDFYATLANLAALLEAQGLIVLVAATAHRRTYRERARARAARFLEVWLDVPLDECRRRDAKGLYAAAARGGAEHLPGAAESYEPPASAELIVRGAEPDSVEELVARLTGSC